MHSALNWLVCLSLLFSPVQAWHPVSRLDSLKEDLLKIVDDAGGDVSLYYKDLSSGDTLTLYPQTMYPCSVVKLPCMMALYASDVDLDEYKKELEAMIIQSDNTAFNILSKEAGLDAIADVLEDAGCTESGIYHGLLPGSGYYGGTKDNVMSPKDMGLLLETVYSDTSADGKAMQKLLKRCADDTALATGLDKAVLAHKSGWADGFYHDGGILYLDGADCILVVFTQYADKSVFTEVAETVEEYQLETQKSGTAG